MTAVVSSDITRYIYLADDVITAIYSFKTGSYARLSSSIAEKWYNTKENKIYTHAAGETSWTEAGCDCCLLGEYTSANGQIYKLLPYKPLCLAAEQDIDGQWIKSAYNIANELNLNGTSDVTYNLRDYLPLNDSNLYEVIIRGRVTTDTTSGSWAPLYIETDFETSKYEICGARTRASASVDACGTATIIAAPPYRVILSRSANNNGTATVDALAYRKVR